MLKLKIRHIGHLMWRSIHWKRSWCWERLKAGGKRDDRRWDDRMASGVWANSRDGEGQRNLMCCSLWGRKEWDTTELLNHNEAGHGADGQQEGHLPSLSCRLFLLASQEHRNAHLVLAALSPSCPLQGFRNILVFIYLGTRWVCCFQPTMGRGKLCVCLWQIYLDTRGSPFYPGILPLQTLFPGKRVGFLLFHCVFLHRPSSQKSPPPPPHLLLIAPPSPPGNLL